MRYHLAVLFTAFSLIFVCTGAKTPAKPAKPKPKPVSIADIDTWKSIASARVSDDGKWFVYTLKPAKGNADIVLHSLAKKTEDAHFPIRSSGGSLAFSADSRWLCFVASPKTPAGASSGATKKAQADQQKPVTSARTPAQKRTRPPRKRRRSQRPKTKKEPDAGPSPTAKSAPGSRQSSPPEKPADLVIWNWQDKRLQSQQQKEASRDKSFSYLCAYHVDTKRFVRLANESLRDVALAPKQRWAIGSDTLKYRLQGTLDGRKERRGRPETCRPARPLVGRV